VAAYEDQHTKPLRRISGLEALRFIISENGMTGDDLAKLLKVERSVAYRILKGTRNLVAQLNRTVSRSLVLESRTAGPQPKRAVRLGRPVQFRDVVFRVGGKNPHDRLGAIEVVGDGLGHKHDDSGHDSLIPLGGVDDAPARYKSNGQLTRGQWH
jgi:hypothetical protein